MNLHMPGGGDSPAARRRSRDAAPDSGLCARCPEDCQGNCEVFKASLHGREAVCPGPFGELIAGRDTQYPVDYSHLSILGPTPDATTTGVDTCAVYGHDRAVRMRMPIFVGAIGFADLARKHWDGLAAGAAVCGISLVVGEDVCAGDPGLELDSHGRVARSPEMERRVRSYSQWKDEFGDIAVQISDDDARLGVAEYVVRELGVEAIELKWGQGAQRVKGGTKIGDLERALELRRRGYVVIPDPEDPAIQAAFKAGAIREFDRHSPLGFTDEERFLRTVEHLRRQAGVRRVLLRAVVSGPRELAMAVKWSSKARVDLLTVEGAGGTTGLGPCRAASEQGIPAFYLQSMVCEFARRLAGRGEWVPDLAMAGGFSTEDHIFKVLAMGSPYFRAVCMGQALRIPGFVGGNIEAVLRNSRPAPGEKLPPTVGVYGDTPEQIFVTYGTLLEQFGPETMKKLPFGAIAMYTYVDKLKTGLAQRMAGARSFRLDALGRQHLAALTQEAARVSGIPHVMDAGMAEAQKILNG